MRLDEGGIRNKVWKVSGKMRMDASIGLALIWESTSVLPIPGQDFISKQVTTSELF
jgi:hypothetical protein